ncbi:MAG: guanylate kinase [Acidobacteriota bacterium]|nr:guanylate kinase [Bryobacteraceae bacterium]
MSIVFVISAPSGSGKSTLVNRLLAQDPGIRFSISHTTRAPRGHEVQDRDYHFVSRQDFEAAMARGEFLECAEVFGNYYGTHQGILEQARAEGRDLLLDIDVQGERQLKARVPDAVTIFVLAPSRDELEQRLRSRSEDSDDVIARRLQGAAKEIENYGQYDYVLVNRDIEKSVDALASIVKAERLRRARMEPEVKRILETFEK